MSEYTEDELEMMAGLGVMAELLSLAKQARLEAEHRMRCEERFGVPWDVHSQMVQQGVWEWDE